MKWILTLAVITLASFSSAMANAASEATVQTAPVIVNGEELFVLRGVTAFPAKTRAKQVSARIKALAEDESFDPNTLKIVEQNDRSKIKAGDQTIVTVLDEDAELEGISRNLLTSVFRKKIREIIVQYREDRTRTVLTKNIVYAVVSTFVFIVLLFSALWIFRRLDTWAGNLLKRRIEVLEAKSSRILQAEQIWKAISMGTKGIRILIMLVLFYIYLNSVLGLFPWTRLLARTLLDYVTTPLITMGTAVLDYLPKAIFLIFLIIVTRYILRMLHMIFHAVEKERLKFTGFDAEWAWPTYRIVRLVVLAFAVVISYPYIPGSDSDAFKGVSLFLGVLFSLGSTSFIGNVIAGYTMTYRRAFRVGDRVRVGQTTGDVTEMRLLVTRIRTPKNEEVVVPNSIILNSEVINYSALTREQGLILHTTVGIGYEVPWRQVEAMLLMAAQRTPGLRTDTPPFVLQKALGDFAVNYELNVYCDHADRMMQLYSQLHRNIQDVFNEYGVQIMTPAYESDTPEPKVVPKDNWYAAPAKPPATKG